jgi:hypothetical protein
MKPTLRILTPPIDRIAALQQELNQVLREDIKSILSRATALSEELMNISPSHAPAVKDDAERTGEAIKQFVLRIERITQ